MDKAIGMMAQRRGRRRPVLLALCPPLLCAAGLAAAGNEWANLPDPTRPSNLATATQAPPAATRPAAWSLDSTIVSKDRRLAIINGRTLGVGDRIDGARLKNITPYKVELEQDGRVVTLVLVDDGALVSRGPEAAGR